MSAAFTVRIDDETLKSLDELAQRTERSRSWLVNKAIEDYVALNAWQIEQIEKGLAEANRGEFATDEEVERVRTKFSKRR